MKTTNHTMHTNMKTTKTILSIVTAFVMAFTVFGCTGLSFAADNAPGMEPAAGSEQAEGATADVPEEAAGFDESTVPNENAAAGENADPDENVDPDETVDPDENIDPDENTDSDEALSDEGDVQAMGKTVGASGLAAPVTKKPTAGYRTVTLSWNAVTPTVKGGAISYNIYDSAQKLLKKNFTATTVSFKNLSPRGASYTFRIQAVENAKGVTNESEIVDFPTAKTKDFSTLKLSGLAADPGYKAVLLEWKKIDGAKGYRIYWRTGGERGNIDKKGKCSDGRTLLTYRSKKSRKYEVVAKPGAYKYLTEVPQPKTGSKVTFDKRGLKVMNHTYVYFYQFMIVPYYKDGKGEIVSSNVKDKWTDQSVNGTGSARCQSQPAINVIKQNTVLPMYVLESAKIKRPIYKTYKQSDSKKMGSLEKGHKFICYDKADGRVKFFEKSNVSKPSGTYWFAQKNAHTIQGYYLNNGKKKNLNRKDYATGYSKKTVLDYVNHSGLSSKTGYLIWVSKYAQHAYIFKGKKGNWKLINGGKNVKPNVKKGAWSNLCNSGKVSTQSRNGKYSIYGKQYIAYAGSYDYYCLSKLHTAVRLHTILYKSGASLRSKKYYNKELGSPTSHGCIRLKPSAAQFIYNKVPTSTKAQVY